MTKALVALHYQNDICHPEGKIPFAIDRSAPEPMRFLDCSRRAMESARSREILVVHVHIAFAPDYSDLPRNCRLFRAVEALGAVRAGSWGAQPLEGFEPDVGDLRFVHRGNSAFFGTALDEALKSRNVTHVAVIGLATQFSVEHTVRDAADRGYVVTILKDCCASANPMAAAATFEVVTMLADVAQSDHWI
jgi:biuret amidohydrolase